MTELKLTEEEVRVLGCLIEKEMTTPEYYPLSLNALVNACNQKSNREPVVSYNEEFVIKVLDSLKDKGLVWKSDLNRVTKYAHSFLMPRNLVNKEAAILCVLFLRGQQTAGEIRERTDRLHRFNTIEDVKDVLQNLEDMGYVKLLPRQHGMKEQRYIQLFSDVVESRSAETTGQLLSSDQREDNDRIAELEEEIKKLRQDIEDLRHDFLEFKGQF
ncbi:MAG: YceH family protein [Nitrospirae bacterium]|nr:YceH family protein [Nitrospirota bacterium]